jgi:hypothetical protein
MTPSLRICIFPKSSNETVQYTCIMQLFSLLKQLHFQYCYRGYFVMTWSRLYIYHNWNSHHQQLIYIHGRIWGRATGAIDLGPPQIINRICRFYWEIYFSKVRKKNVSIFGYYNINKKYCNEHALVFSALLWSHVLSPLSRPPNQD